MALPLLCAASLGRELCRKEGIHLLLVGTPTPKNWDYRRHNGVSDYAAKKKLPFLDMNLLEKGLNMDWDRDSRDEGDHLNTYGAEKVSRYLGDYLKANYGLTDHRKGEEARYVYSALFCHLPDFTFSQDKIFGDSDEKGHSIVTKLQIARYDVD